MAHVQLRAGEAASNGLPVEIVVDGVDITAHILREGFEIGPTDGDNPGIWYMQIRLAVESLDADLPDAVLSAVRDTKEVDQ